MAGASPVRGVPCDPAIPDVAQASVLAACTYHPAPLGAPAMIFQQLSLAAWYSEWLVRSLSLPLVPRPAGSADHGEALGNLAEDLPRGWFQARISGSCA